MDALIVYPENKEQLAALKAIVKAMKISFEQQKETYPQHVIEGVKQSLIEADNGLLTPYKGIRDMLDME
jgi:hypothetical protein